MIRKLALALLLTAPVCAEELPVDSIAQLDRTSWVDIGPGRGVAQLRPKEIAELRRCKTWTMYFRWANSVFQQTFVAGMTMSNTFAKVSASSIGGETIFILTPTGHVKPTDTLHLSKDEIELTQFSPPFRPHTYLRCAPRNR